MFFRFTANYISIPLACIFGLLTTVSASAITADELAQVCAAESQIENSDPRYSVGLCLLTIGAVLDELRKNWDCAERISTGEAEKEAVQVVQAAIVAHPELKGQDAEITAKMILQEHFSCSLRNE